MCAFGFREIVLVLLEMTFPGLRHILSEETPEKKFIQDRHHHHHGFYFSGSFFGIVIIIIMVFYCVVLQ